MIFIHRLPENVQDRFAFNDNRYFEYTFDVMTEFQPNLFVLILLSLQAAFYLPVGMQALKRQAGQEKTASLVGLYAIAALALQTLEALQYANFLPSVTTRTAMLIQWYGTLVLAFLLLFIVRNFLRLEGSGILGTGAIQKRPVVVTDADGNDAIAIRPMVYLSFVFDHRILDGASADVFLATVKEGLEKWT